MPDASDRIGSIQLTKLDGEPTLYRFDVDERTVQDLASGYVRPSLKAILVDMLRWFEDDEARATANVARATRKAAT